MEDGLEPQEVPIGWRILEVVDAATQTTTNQSQSLRSISVWCSLAYSFSVSSQSDLVCGSLVSPKSPQASAWACLLPSTLLVALD